MNEALTDDQWKGIKIKKEEVEELGIIRDEFHGEWNYTFKT